MIIDVVLGLVKDKESEKILSLFPKLANYYFTQANIPRAMDKEILREQAEKFELDGEIYSDVNNAIKAALAKALKEDMILVCGSVFLIGDVNI